MQETLASNKQDCGDWVRIIDDVGPEIPWLFPLSIRATLVVPVLTGNGVPLGIQGRFHLRVTSYWQIGCVSF